MPGKKSKLAATPSARADGSPSDDDAAPDLQDAIRRLQLQQTEDSDCIRNLTHELEATQNMLEENNAKLD
jgi:hypothetical protein